MPKKPTSLWVTLKYPSHHHDVLEILMMALVKSECQILQFNQQILANFNVIMIDVYGVWSQLALLESQLESLNQKQDVECHFGRYDQKKNLNTISYEFELIAFNQSDALSLVMLFFNQYGLIAESSSGQFYARYANEHMQLIKLILLLRGDESIAYLRDRFSDFCDEHNFDAVLEPIKY